jgi:predicted RNA-binding protein with TRAM domain
MKNKTKNLIGGLIGICEIVGLATGVAYYDNKANEKINNNICNYSINAEKQIKEGNLDNALRTIKEGKEYIQTIRNYGRDKDGNQRPDFIIFSLPSAINDEREEQKLSKMEELVKDYSKRK